MKDMTNTKNKHISLPEALRILPLPKFEKYLLFYRFNEDENVVEIVRIVHGARDIPSLF